MITKKEQTAKILFFLLSIIGLLPSFVGAYRVSAFLVGFILTYYTARFSIKFTIWAVFIMMIPYFAGAELYQNIYIISMCIPYWAIGQILYKRQSLAKLLIIGTGLQAGLWAAYTNYNASIQNVKPFTLLFGGMLDEFRGAMLSQAGADATILKEMQRVFYFAETILQSMLPFLYIIVSLVTIYISFSVCRFVLARKGIHLKNMPYFHELWLPKSISLIFVLLFFLSLFMGDAPILSNILAVVFVLYVICGLSTTAAFLKRKGVSFGFRALILAGLFLFSSLMGGMITTLLCCLGMSKATPEIGE